MQIVADCLAEKSEVQGGDTKFYSPFTQHAVDHGWSQKNAIGGKLDDVTVIVAQVEESLE